MEISAAIAVIAVSVLSQPLFWILLVALVCAAMLASAIRSAGRSIGLGLIRSSDGYQRMAVLDEDDAKEKYWAPDEMPPGDELIRHARAESALEG